MISLASGLGACSPTSSDEPCAAPEPAFQVQVRTSTGDGLPAGTRVRVDYGGNLRETFVLAQESKNEDVCCQAAADRVVGDIPRVKCGGSASIADGGSVGAIVCTLWTNGPATVSVRADGYLTFEKNLNSKYRENRNCGVDTVEADLILGRPEGGI